MTTMIPNQLPSITAKEITKPQSVSKDDSPPEPSLSEIETMVFHVLQANGDWVLIDRNRSSRVFNDSSSRRNALKRRGFEVVSRHVQGVRNYWARWPHGDITPLKVPSCSTDDKYTAFGHIPE